MHGCPDCRRLEAENERLRTELAVRREMSDVGAVMSGLEVTPTQARIILRLYAAGGRTVMTQELEELIEGVTPIKNHIHHLRARLGMDAIGSVGRGYLLPAPMISRVMAVLDPPILARSIPLTAELITDDGCEPVGG